METNRTRTKIILDCDPGHDDAVAITLAGRSPAIELLGVTVVAGNQTLEKTLLNARRVVEHLDLDVKVYAGCDRPMVRDKLIADDIHGESGLDGPVFAELRRPAETKHAVHYIIETLMASAGDVTMVTCGPMTNLGMAIRLEPRIVDKIKRIVLMGGAYTIGNMTPAAEFNILADADAAHVCFSCGAPVTMVGLDVTRQVLCYPHIVERMRKIGNKASALFCDLMTFFNATQKAVFGWEGGPLHDPLTVASLIDPQVLETRPVFAEVDIRSVQSYGRTNCDFFNYLKRKPNIDLGIGVDVERYWNLIEQGLRAYGDA